MKIFGFSNHLNRWQRVEDELYYTWIGNQTGAILPRISDIDFQIAFEQAKKKHSLNEWEKFLKLV